MFFIYRNLHKKMFSIKDTNARKVVGWKSSFIGAECHFKVSESGRQRVLKTGRKNVHAGVVCDTIIDYPTNFADLACKLSKSNLIPVYYNPRTQNCFTKPDGSKIEFARYVLFLDNKIYAME